MLLRNSYIMGAFYRFPETVKCGTDEYGRARIDVPHRNGADPQGLTPFVFAGGREIVSLEPDARAGDYEIRVILGHPAQGQRPVRDCLAQSVIASFVKASEDAHVGVERSSVTGLDVGLSCS